MNDNIDSLVPVVRLPSLDDMAMPATEEHPLCACGCGGRVMQKTARFITGHNARVMEICKNNIRAHQYKPGQSGSPGGRRKKPVTTAYVELLNRPVPGDPKGRTGAELIALSMLKAVIESGDVYAAKEITDRVEGKADEGARADENVNLNVSVYERIEKLVGRLRGGSMAATSSPVIDGGNPEHESGGSDGVPGPAGGGV